MQVRQIFFENENGDRICCLLQTSFFNDLSGLGFSNDYNFLTARDGFFYTAKEETEQQVIAGRLSFIERQNAYRDYRAFTSWLNTAKTLSIVYIPYGNEEYFVDVKPVSLSKGELDVGGFLSCDAEFITVTPWYNKEPLILSMDGTYIEGAKQYDYKYDYKYGLGTTRGQLDLEIDGDYSGGMHFVAYGAITDPVISLFNRDTLENLGYLDLTGETFSADEALVFNTTFKDLGVYRKTGTTLTDISDKVVIHQNRDVFFTIPVNTPVTLRLTVFGQLTTATEIEIYKYWKTR